jgi:hypothetical protein
MSASRLHLNYDPTYTKSIQPTLFRNPSAPFDVLDRPVLVDVHIHPTPPLATLLPPKA